MNETDKNYLDLLYESEGEAQDNYDKTILTLSSGALGISFAFITDIVGPESITNVGLLISSWICWGISVVAVLMSYFTSNITHRRAIDLFINGERDHQKLYGIPGIITWYLNGLGGVLFIVGLILIVLFVKINI
jgi:hypothetical protein